MRWVVWLLHLVEPLGVLTPISSKRFATLRIEVIPESMIALTTGVYLVRVASPFNFIVAVPLACASLRFVLLPSCTPCAFSCCRASLVLIEILRRSSAATTASMESVNLSALIPFSAKIKFMLESSGIVTGKQNKP